MGGKIRVAILDDHQSIVDGYLRRLAEATDIEVVGTAAYGEELEPMLAEHPTDVLLLDILAPTSPDNPNPYPVLHVLPQIRRNYPSLAVLVISMHNARALIQAVLDAGARGYVLKEDRDTIVQLASVVRLMASGDAHLSRLAHQKLIKDQPQQPSLTSRQLEVLSLCAAYPDRSTEDLARTLGVSSSTVRNLLSKVYQRLDVRTKAGAIAKARRLGLITPESTSPPYL